MYWTPKPSSLYLRSAHLDGDGGWTCFNCGYQVDDG